MLRQSSACPQAMGMKYVSALSGDIGWFSTSIPGIIPVAALVRHWISLLRKNLSALLEQTFWESVQIRPQARENSPRSTI